MATSKEEQAAYNEARWRILEFLNEDDDDHGYLDLSDLGLVNLPLEISEFTELTSLNLSGNKLTGPPPEIGKLSALRTLNLSENQLTSLPPEIGKLSALTDLHLTNNQLTSLPSEIGKLSALTTLDLANNQLTSLPSEIGKLAVLRTLDLSENQLTSLPPEIGKLTALTDLFLSYNQLTNLPSEIGKLAVLTELHLSNNQLTSLPPEIGKLTTITALYLFSNQLTSLPPEIGKLTALKMLFLSNNQLTSLPLEIGKLTALTILDFSINRPTSLPSEIGELTHLTSLFLLNNQLTNLPSEIGRLTALTTLNLSANRLTSLPSEIGKLSALTDLHLSNNQLTSLPSEIGKLSALTTLDLANNQLTSLPPEIGKLTALTDLHLSDNQLTSLSPEIGELTSLAALYLHRNPALNLSPEILGPTRSDIAKKKIRPVSPQAILDYYFAMVAGQTQPLNEVKMILIGDGGRGKTETVNRLIHNRFIGGRQKETVGIAIDDWTLPCHGGDPVTVHVWDFAGQTVTHGLHKFFLSQRSVYVLVLAGRDDKAQGEAEYWLQLMRAFATTREGVTSPVLITLNKWQNGEAQARVDKRALEEKFPFIAGFIETDCKTGYGIEKLKQQLQRVIAEDRWVRQEFEKAWWEAKEFFRRMTADTMRYEDYQEECRQRGVADPEKQKQLARRLHDLGLALNYGQDPRLQLWTVLNPHWVTQNIYKLLRQGPQEGTGLMTMADVARVLPDEDDEQRCYLVKLMEEFDLAFTAGDDEDRWLVPQRLEINQPELPPELSTEASVRLRWTYRALPEGLLPEFITRTHILSDDLPELRWANGAVLALNGQRVLVKADREDKTITAIAAQPSPELMRHIEQEVDSLNQEMPGLEVTKEMEVLPGGWVKVSLLRKMEPQGVTVPVTVPDDRGEDDVAMVLPKDELNKIGPQRSRDPRARRPLVFISYTDADRKSLLTFCKYLGCHEHNGLMEVWHDKHLTPGQEWNPEILEKLAKADVIVFLLSPMALGSKYIRNEEIPAALKRQKEEKIPVIPLLLEQSDAEGTGLEDLQGVKDLWRTPIKDTKPHRKAWFQASKVLKEVCEDLIKKDERF